MWFAYSAAWAGITRSTEVAATPIPNDFRMSRREILLAIHPPVRKNYQYPITTLQNLLQVSLLRFIHQVIRSSPRQRHDRQRRILVRITHERRGIGDEDILYVMRLAIAIQGRRFGVVSHPHAA